MSADNRLIPRSAQADDRGIPPIFYQFILSCFFMYIHLTRQKNRRNPRALLQLTDAKDAVVPHVGTEIVPYTALDFPQAMPASNVHRALVFAMTATVVFLWLMQAHLFIFAAIALRMLQRQPRVLLLKGPVIRRDFADIEGLRYILENLILQPPQDSDAFLSLIDRVNALFQANLYQEPFNFAYIQALVATAITSELDECMRDMRIVMGMLKLLQHYELSTIGAQVRYRLSELDRTYLRITPSSNRFLRSIPDALKNCPSFILMMFANNLPLLACLPQDLLQLLLPVEVIKRLAARIALVLARNYSLHQLIDLSCFEPLNGLLNQAIVNKISNGTNHSSAVRTFFLCCHESRRNPFNSTDTRRHLFSTMSMFSTPTGLESEYIRNHRLPQNYFSRS